MARYVIGDVHGCLDSLHKLLKKIHYQQDSDTLLFIGDLVNRGPKSLDTLRFIKSLNNTHITLGNHDLHLIALHYKVKTPPSNHNLNSVLQAKDCDELVEWLCQQRILYHDADHKSILVHAGIPPQWSIKQAKDYASELEQIIKSSKRVDFFKHMYGNHPHHWNESLTSWDRLRYITNAFTRMRHCDQHGQLYLEKNSTQGQPWFSFRKDPCAIIFGHWAQLLGKSSNPNCHAIDTGCVWGCKLTALNLETLQRTQVKGLTKITAVD